MDHFEDWMGPEYDHRDQHRRIHECGFQYFHWTGHGTIVDEFDNYNDSKVCYDEWVEKGPEGYDLSVELLEVVKKEELYTKSQLRLNTADSSIGYDHIGDFSTTDRKIVITLTGIQIRKYSQIKASIITVVDNDIRSGEAIVTCDLDQI